MNRRCVFFLLIFTIALPLAQAQEETPAHRGIVSRILHPFAKNQKIPQYRNRKLNGLLLSVDLPGEPIDLAEMRQLPINVSLTNKGDHAIELDFSNTQRIEIYLRDFTGKIVTRWSDNRAFDPEPGTLLINPGEHVEYAETIATRDLSPGRVFTIEVFLPAYPELDVKRKSIAAP